MKLRITNLLQIWSYSYTNNPNIGGHEIYNFVIITIFLDCLVHAQQ